MLTLIPVSSFAESKISDPIWDLDLLLKLGAELPNYNAETKQYEISNAAQLFYLSGYWKNGDSNGDGAKDAPSDGYYVLTDDIDMGAFFNKAGITYMPPIAAATKEDNGGEKCAFFGTFDGQGHIVSNLTIQKLDSKYCGMFGNIGYDFGTGCVKNLALVNARVEGVATCGLLAGMIYGDVENCYVQGTIDCLEKTAGGLAGKIKKNENGYLGNAKNCFSYCDIVIHGEASENGAAGGISGANSNGGCIYDCYAGGSITVIGENAADIGGISGNLKSGRAIDNTVSIMNLISTEEGTTVGLLCGTYAGETGAHLHNNYVWEGSKFIGNPASDHPETAAFTYATGSELLSKSFYSEKVGWDMDNNWAWNGSETCGYPVPAVFGDKLSGMLNTIKTDLGSKEVIINASEPLRSGAYTGEPADLEFFTLNKTASSAVLHYGTDKKGEKLDKTEEFVVDGNKLTVDFPAKDPKTYYYYVTAEIDGKEYRYPSNGAISFTVLNPELKSTPAALTVSPGTDYSKIGLNWTTDVDGLTAYVNYRKAGEEAFTKFEDVVIKKYTVGDNMGDFVSYSADLSGLAGDTQYEYQAVTNDGKKEYTSDIYSFTTLPQSGAIKFAVISDLQATGTEGYEAYRCTAKTFLADQGIDFVVNVGDLTEDNTFAQWGFYYEALEEILPNTIHAFAPGNHENKGDALYTLFKGKTNLPGGLDDEYIGETTSCFVVGDCCLVGLNTEPYSGVAGANVQEEKMAFYEAQMEYAKKCFEESKCKWRILYAHAGLIQDDDVATAYLEKACNELGVDLYFNGHIHNYYRATVDAEGNHAEVGKATSFITTSPMGEKFDPYEGEIDDILDFQTGGEDDQRQYVTIVEIDEEGNLTLTAYQRTKAGDSYATLCKDYTAIDSISLVKKGGATSPFIYIGAGVVVLAIIVAVVVSKKKKQA